MQMDNLPGWYADAMEQNLGMIVSQQREKGKSIQEIANILLDPSAADGSTLSSEQHTQTLAICLAITIRRLALIDTT